MRASNNNYVAIDWFILSVKQGDKIILKETM